MKDKIRKFYEDNEKTIKSFLYGAAIGGAVVFAVGMKNPPTPVGVAVKRDKEDNVDLIDIFLTNGHVSTWERADIETD